MARGNQRALQGLESRCGGERDTVGSTVAGRDKVQITPTAFYCRKEGIRLGPLMTLCVCGLFSSEDLKTLPSIN